MKKRTFLFFLAVTSCTAKEPIYEEEINQRRLGSRNQTLPAEPVPSTSPNQSRKLQDRNGNANKKMQTDNPQKEEQREISHDSMGATRADEKKAMYLEDELDSSLRSFDDMLLKKNQDITQRKSISGSENQNGSPDNGLMSQDTETMDAGGTKESTTSPITGSRHKGAGSEIIKMNKDFDNDDVVARQIREAAEKETDPELKEKLWDEYRKYKSGNE